MGGDNLALSRGGRGGGRRVVSVYRSWWSTSFEVHPYFLGGKLLGFNVTFFFAVVA